MADPEHLEPESAAPNYEGLGAFWTECRAMLPRSNDFDIPSSLYQTEIGIPQAAPAPSKPNDECSGWGGHNV